MALNTLPWPRQEIIKINSDVGTSSCVVASGTGSLLSVEPINTSQKERLVTIEEVSPGIFQLQNSQLTAIIEAGCITSLYDRIAKREVLSGKANQFVIFDDKPIYWQAWDVEVYHLETRQELPSSPSKILEDKPYCVSVVTETKICELSSIRTVISLSPAFDGDATTPRQQSYIECRAQVDWHETMKFLKVEFPVDVRNTEASYETAFGITKRPTHYNTSWDMAKFEVCSHKFADLSEYNYGVSILNDSKYGFATVGDVMRLSLLRAPKAPDDTADMGKHLIRWAVLPHQGELGPETVRKAFEFNSPMKLFSKTISTAANLLAPITLTGDKNLILDTIKRGEDDADILSVSSSPCDFPHKPRQGKSVIIRIYDALGGRGRGTVSTAWKLARVFKTNLLEDDDEEVPIQNGQFEVELGAFQVGTWRLVLA